MELKLLSLIYRETIGMTEPKHHMPLGDIENVVGMLNKISILAGLSEDQLSSVLGLMETVSYRKGMKIHYLG